MTSWDRFVFAFLNPEVARQYLPAILDGMVITVGLAVLIVLAGAARGLLLAARRSPGFRLLTGLIVIFADVMRALPPLVLIILLFFALPLAGVSMSAFTATW